MAESRAAREPQIRRHTAGAPGCRFVGRDAQARAHPGPRFARNPGGPPAAPADVLDGSARALPFLMGFPTHQRVTLRRRRTVAVDVLSEVPLPGSDHLQEYVS